MKKSLLRELPSVDELARSEWLAETARLYSMPFVTWAARVVIATARREIKDGVRNDLSIETLASEALAFIERAVSPSLKRIVNASGTVLHTNLGRAELADEAALNVVLTARGGVNLEFDLGLGGRGKRDSHLEGLICELTGAEAATVVNNNAAAVLITLNTLAEGREVIISRGELIEIGGSFRLPDIIEKSGCTLKEIGTTNRTHADDYLGAVSGGTALILKAHTSNYKVVGFTSDVTLKELVGIGMLKSIPVVEDLGSGSLVDLTDYGLGTAMREPVVRSAEGREVIISRGELIEIGGSFRLPDIIEKSGCTLKEIGTTNRTHADDYLGAVSGGTALILKAHTSNYKVVGFTSDVTLKELVGIGMLKSIPVVEDLGSGSLVDLTDYGLGTAMREPVVRESIEVGADIVTFSGDKLLGGPQAGIIVGKKEFIERINKNPLKRALRIDKMTVAALEATLRLYRNKDTLAEKLPTLRYLSRPLDDIEKTATAAAIKLADHLGEGYAIEVVGTKSEAGSGALPAEELSSWAVVVSHDFMEADGIARLFLESSPPILGRIKDGRYMLDMRLIMEPESVVPNMNSHEE